MMDTDKWGEKFGGSLADYVIGGPTIELFFKAYNKKKELSEEQAYKAEAFDETSSNNGKGYKIAYGNSEFRYWINIDGDIIPLLETDDRAFIIADHSKCFYEWIASPHVLRNKYVWRVEFNGLMGSYSSDEDYVGLRPLICLKPDVKLTKQEGGTWKVEAQS